MTRNMWTLAALALVLAACKSTPANTAAAGSTSAEKVAAQAKTDFGADPWYAAYLSNRQVYFDYDSETLKTE